MQDKPNASKTLGLELENSNLKIAYLSWFKGRPKLESLIEAKVDTFENNKSFTHVKPLYMASSGILDEKVLKDLIDKNLSACCLSGNQVLTRSLEIKLKKERDINAALPFQVEPILPFPYESGLIDKIKIDQTAESTLLTILAAKKDHIKDQIAKWQQLQIEPEVISSESSALTCFSNHFFSSSKAYFILYFKENYVTCILVKNKKLIASQSIFFKTHLTEKTEIELNDVIRILYALSKQMKGLEIEDVLILGNGLSNKNLFVKLLSKINKKVCSLEPDNNFPITLDELQKFAVPIGLSLNILPKALDLINFRKDELEHPNPWKHLKKPLLIYFALCLTVAFTFYFFGQVYLGYYEDELKQEYVELISGMNKPYSAFENEFLSKFPSESKEIGEITPVKALSQDEINERLRFLHQELQSMPDLFPLFPNVPRVSDVLAFLSNHPNVVLKDTNMNSLKPLIQLESFSYSMLKKPDQTKKQEKYQVKVEFEFNTETPKLAREFHDALIAPNAIVDPKGEIKWSSNRGKYKTSFFLKDKTAYPSSRI